MRMKRTPLLVWRSATAAMVVMLGIATMTLTAPPAVAQSSFSSDGGQTYKKSPEGPTEKPLPQPQPSQTPAPSEASDEQDDGTMFHLSDGFHWLEKPGMIVPGAAFVNMRTGGACSSAYIVGNAEGNFMLTAGHCGVVGDRIGVRNNSGHVDQVGTVTLSEFEWAGKRDIALVKIDDMSKVHTEIAKNSRHTDYPGATQKIIGWAGAEWLQKHKPYICRMGHRTGITCGKFDRLESDGLFSFVSFVDRGDSGGPVYAVTDQGLVAVGVTSYKFLYDAGKARAMLIEDVMNSRALKLVN